MAKAGGVILADLGRGISAGEKGAELVVGALKYGEVLSNESGVVKSASANVFADGGKGYDVGLCIAVRKGVSHDFGERTSETADRLVFVAFDEVSEETRTLTTNKSRWESGTMGTFASGIGGFAVRAKVLLMGYTVFFTTLAQNRTYCTATPTGVRCN